MVGYRCYLLDAEDHILQAHEYECDDDAAAEAMAQAYLDLDPYHRAAEVWERARRITKLDRRQQSRGTLPPRAAQAAARHTLDSVA